MTHLRQLASLLLARLFSHVYRCFRFIALPTWSQLLSYRDTLFSILSCLLLDCMLYANLCKLLHCPIRFFIISAALYAMQFNHVLSMGLRPRSPDTAAASGFRRLTLIFGLR